MKRRNLSLLSLSSTSVVALAIAAGCGGPAESSTPPPAPVPSTPPTALATTEPAPVASASAKPELSPDEKKKEEARRELEKDRAKMKADHEADKARWTAELRSEAKTLTDKTFTTGKEAMKAAVANKGRKGANVERDKFRHPVETMDFFGFKPTMTVLEFGPGEGWYTELLAPALARKGKLLATNGNPNGPPEERSTFYAERFKLFLEQSPEMYGKVETVTVDGKAPNVGHESSIDMVIVMRGLHNMVNANKLDDWLATFHKSLKPNGILGIEEHRALPDANPTEAAKKGYLPEKWTIERIEAAGFKLAGKSEINANPKDTKDYPDGVWTLPPTLKLGDKDRDKYLSIGESDRMTLKFVKVTPKSAVATPAPAGSAPAGKK